MSVTSVLSLSRMTAPPGTIVKNQDQQASILRMVSIPCSASLRVVLASSLSMYLIPEKDGSLIVLLVTLQSNLNIASNLTIYIFAREKNDFLIEQLVTLQYNQG